MDEYYEPYVGEMIPLNNELKVILEKSRKTQNQSICLKKIMKLYRHWYKKDNYDDFKQLLVHWLIKVARQDPESSCTKNILEFISTFLAKMNEYEAKSIQDGTEKPAEKNDNDDELTAFIDDTETPRQTTLDWVLNKHIFDFMLCEELNVRINSLILLKKILQTLEDVDENFLTTLIAHLERRCLDKSRKVRALAILCFQRLQNVTIDDNNNIKIIRTPLFCMTNDPDSFVRACALRVINVVVKTLPKIVLATRDPCAAIRRAAYLKISQNCGIMHFSIFQRNKLVKNAFFDKPSIKKVLLEVLIPTWLGDLNNSLQEFIEYLSFKDNIIFYDGLLSAYFKNLLSKSQAQNLTSFHQCVLDFRKKYLDEYKLLTKVKLTESNAYLWYRMALFCKINNVKYEPPKEKETETPEEDLDTTKDGFNCPIDGPGDLLAELLPDLSNYNEYLNRFVEQIIEENQSNTLKDVKEKNFMFIQLLKMGALYPLEDQPQWAQLCGTLKKIVLNNELYKIFEDFLPEVFKIFKNSFKDDGPFLKLTFEIIDQINKDKADNNQDSETFQSQIESDSCHAPTRSSDNILNNPLSSDPIILEQSINVLYSFLASRIQKKNSVALTLITNFLVLKNLESTNKKIRLLCIKALGEYCRGSIDDANYYIKVFLEIVESSAYGVGRITALEEIFELVTFHGLKKLTGDKEGGDSEIFFLDKFISMMSSILSFPKDGSLEGHLFDLCVHGLIRLIYMGRFHSPDFIARLIFIYGRNKNVSKKTRQWIRLFFYNYSERVPLLSQYLEFDSDPFSDSYPICFKLLIDTGILPQDNPKILDEYGTVAAVIETFTSEKNREQLLEDSLKVFELTSNPYLVHFNLEFFSRNTPQNLPIEKRMFFKPKLTSYKDQFVDENFIDLDNQLPKNIIGKTLILFDKVIQSIDYEDEEIQSLEMSQNEE